MGLFSKKTSKKNPISDNPKSIEEKRIQLIKKDPAVFVTQCFFALADLFAKENGAFTSPTGRIDFWTLLHWSSRDIFLAAESDVNVLACFCEYLEIVRSYSEPEIEAALEYLSDYEDELNRKFYPLSSGAELMILCGHAIETLYNRKDALLAFEFSQYLTRSMQIACEAFPKNK